MAEEGGGGGGTAARESPRLEGAGGEWSSLTASWCLPKQGLPP